MLQAQDAQTTAYINSSLLWKVEGENVKTDSYIFATMHLIATKDFYFPEKIATIIRNSAQIVTEIVSAKTDENVWLLPKNESLFDKFSPEQIDSIVEWGTAQSWMPTDPNEWKNTFRHYKPIALAQIALHETIKNATNEANERFTLQSYERKIEEITRHEEIPTFGLETIEQQMNFLEQLHEEQQINLVMEWIQNPQKQMEAFSELTKVYLSQDIEKIHQFVHQHADLWPETSELLLNRRNIEWISEIEQYIAQKNTFIAVGAAHLGGENGILHLLRQRGYTLQPILF